MTKTSDTIPAPPPHIGEVVSMPPPREPTDRELLQQVLRETAQLARDYHELKAELTVVRNEVRRQGQVLAPIASVPPLEGVTMAQEGP